MSALAGWFKSKEGLPLGMAAMSLETAERYQAEAGNYNIRDINGGALIGVAYVGVAEQPEVIENLYARKFTSPADRWTWLKGWMPKDMSISNWFAGCGLDRIVARACLAEVTALEDYNPFTAPVECTDNLIGATVGGVTDCIDQTPEISAYVNSLRKSRTEGDGIMLTRYLSHEITKTGADNTMNGLARLPYDIHSAFVTTGGNEALYLVRSHDSERFKNSNRLPYLHWSKYAGGIIFANLADQLQTMGTDSKANKVEEGTVVKF